MEEVFPVLPSIVDDVSNHIAVSTADATASEVPLASPSELQDLAIDTCLEETLPLRRSTRERRLPPYLRDYNLNRLKGYTLPKFIRYRDKVIHI